ncbi:FAD-dependent oxidoreductase [Mucilaginibacter antarcticus]|uniref:FAD-dependent oxidoreductase n=1 Tax=Mucilaginibacter antarcticus TaxID=1855725 RepID=A0ABW5XP49_9SPHI
MMANKIKKCRILIAGAGPTGLMLSAQLTRFGIDHIIIDAKNGPTLESRALVVQARSMEIYEQLGLSDNVVSQGQKAFGAKLYRKGQAHAEVRLINSDENSTEFPYLMMYERSKNESLLYQYVKDHDREVEWNTKIIEIINYRKTVTIQVKIG